jgi:Uma2 family endonuclease
MGAVETLQPGDYTMADLDAIPDDGKRRELVDGVLLVTPAPLPIHQTAVLQLGSRLLTSCPKGLKVFVAPLDFRPTAYRSLQPDVLVCRQEDVGPSSIERPLLLAVEVLSPRTRLQDLFVKRRVYEESGVWSYWIFDPEPEQLTVLELLDGHYVERAVVKGTDAFEAELPFPVRIVPAELVD